MRFAGSTSLRELTTRDDQRFMDVSILGKIDAAIVVTCDYQFKFKSLRIRQ